MKKKWIFFCALLCAFQVFALDETACREVRARSNEAWANHRALVKEYHRLPEEEEAEKLHCLQQALAYCYESLELVDAILHDFSLKSWWRRKKSWRVRMKKRCESERPYMIKTIEDLEQAIDQFLFKKAFSKAEPLCKKSIEEAALGKGCAETLPAEPFEQEKCLALLQESKEHYLKARTLMMEGKSLLEEAPLLAQNYLQEVHHIIESYESSLAFLERAIHIWPEKITERKHQLEKEVEVLQVLADTSFSSGDLEQALLEYKKQRDKLSILTQYYEEEFLSLYEELEETIRHVEKLAEEEQSRKAA